MSEPVSPTQVQKWLACPTKWKLDREWQPRGPWTPNMALGAAIGKGLEHLLGGTPEVAVNEALVILEAKFEENDIWNLDALKSLVTKSLHVAEETTVAEILGSETLVGVEFEIGGARLDLLTKQGDDFIITDHKTRLQLKADYVQKTLVESETDWQLWDYAWRVRQHYQTDNIIIRRHLGVLSPRMKWWLHPQRLNAAVLDRWANGAEKVWGDIFTARTAEELVGINTVMDLTECNNRYGKCPFYVACHTFNQDPEQMESLYERKKYD